MNKEKWDELSNEELCLMYQENKSDALFEYFLERNKNLMYKFTHKYVNKHPEYRDDIESLATVEMWEAMLAFKGDKDTRFSTFYHYYVLKALAIFYRKLHMIRIPAFKLNDPETLEKTLCTSLNMKVTYEDSEVELIEKCVDDSVPDCETYMEQDDTSDRVNKALAHLDGRTQQCLKYYLGLVDGRKYTLEEIGQHYGVTRERIRQIMVKGVNRLKHIIPKYMDISGYTIDSNEKVHMALCYAKGEKPNKKPTEWKKLDSEVE